MDVLLGIVDAGLFPTDPEQALACINCELERPLIDDSCAPFAAKQLQLSPEEHHMIREEVHKLLDRGIIRPSASPWVAQCLCINKKDGTLSLCIGWRALNGTPDIGQWWSMRYEVDFQWT